MVTAVDTSVLLDVLLTDSKHAPPSIAALRQAAAEGSLIPCETVLAEISPTLPAADVPQFLSDWNLTFVASSQSSALLAGEMFRTTLAGLPKQGVDVVARLHHRRKVDFRKAQRLGNNDGLFVWT